LEEDSTLIPTYYFITKYNNQRVARSKTWFSNIKDDIKNTWNTLMFLQKDEENLIKYRESIHKIKSKRFYDKFNETVCEIEDDVSTFIFEETCDNNNQDNQDITLNDNLNTDKECDTKKDDDIICLID
jgi:hypothetical protein